MLSEQIVYGTANTMATVKDYLQSITIPYPYLPADTLRNTIEKFCVLAQLQVFVNSQDQIKFVSARPIEPMSKINDVLVVEAKKQTAQFTQTKILKNKYSAVELTQKKVNDVTDFQTLVGTNSFNDNNAEIITDYDSEQTSSIYNGSYAFIRVKYYSGSITIPKKNATNLEQIKKLYNGTDKNDEPHIKHSVSYTYKKGKVGISI